MRLLDLPPEIIDDIIDNSAPEGLEDFVLTCKAIYVRARTQIKRHNALKRRWRHTANANPVHFGDTLGIIYEISKEPRIAHYIEYLNLWDRRGEDEVEWREAGDYDFREDSRALNNIKNYLSEVEYFKSVDLDSWWSGLLVEDESDPSDPTDKLLATITLLALLPNLKRLQLPDKWHEVREEEASEHLVPTIHSVITFSNSSRWIKKNAPLASLDTLFPFVEEGYDVRAGLQCIQGFMSLTSMRNIFAVSCVAVDEYWGGIPFRWPTHWTAPSLLTRLEFVSCCMDATGLAVLFKNTPQLKIFRYSHQTKWDGLEHDWNPGEVLETLANFCQETLTELAITIDELHGEIINGLSSFMRFRKLEVLEVDVQAFCGPPLESGQRLGRNPTIPDGAKAWEYVDIPCMGDMLPEQILELHVNTDFPEPSEQALKALFKNIRDRREDKLLSLKTPNIRQYGSSTAKEIANGHGCALEGFDEGVAIPRPRSMMPLWKRQFDQIVGGIVSG